MTRLIVGKFRSGVASLCLLLISVESIRPVAAVLETVDTTVKVASTGASFLDDRLSWTDGNSGTEIQIDAESGRIRVLFGGVLERSPTLDGPWTSIPGAASPFMTDPGEEQLFFRSRGPAGSGVFSSQTVVEWVVTGPLQTHFDLAFAGVPDGIVPPRREKPFFDGSVSMGETTVAASLRVRGNSSLQECPFPKLKMKVSRAEREGTPFAEAREIKIGTHCAEGGRGTIGRLRDERATYREALAYEAMELLGFVTPRLRRARIAFHDTSPGDAPDPGGWTVIRKALLLEDPEVLAERLGGHALNDAELAELKDARFGIQLITDLRMLHVLLGNWDFTLTEDGQGLWNTDVVQLADGTYVPLAGDFDLCSLVTEQVRVTSPRDYHPELPELDRQALYAVEEIRRQVPDPVFALARDRFVGKRSALVASIQAAEVDEVGRTNALSHVTAFFGALSAGD